MAKTKETTSTGSDKPEKLTLAGVFPNQDVGNLKIRSHVSDGVCHVQCSATGIGGSFRVSGNESLVKQVAEMTKATNKLDKQRRSSDANDKKETD